MCLILSQDHQSSPTPEDNWSGQHQHLTCPTSPFRARPSDDTRRLNLRTRRHNTVIDERVKLQRRDELLPIRQLPRLVLWEPSAWTHWHASRTVRPSRTTDSRGRLLQPKCSGVCLPERLLLPSSGRPSLPATSVRDARERGTHATANDDRLHSTTSAETGQHREPFAPTFESEPRCAIPESHVHAAQPSGRC